MKRRDIVSGALLSITLLTALPATAQSPRFLCGTDADSGSLGVTLDYQRSTPQAQTMPVTIDVLFLYSANRAQFNPASRIDGYMREANETFRNSGTGITLRLAAAKQLPSNLEGIAEWVEEFPESIDQAFDQMRSILFLSSHSGNVIYEIVNDERSRASADLVVFWTGMRRHGGTRALGVALQPDPRVGFSATKGFAVVAGTLEQTGLVAHEIGHNLGLAHPPSARNLGDEPYLPYGQGYAAGGYGTVMAYNTPAAGFPIGVFSQDGFYGGRRVGDQNHRAADAAAVGAQMVVDYQQSSTPMPDPDPDPEPEPGDDEAPCDAAGSGINLDGYQAFMCIVANGEVHQLTPHRLSSKAVLFGRLTDPKAVVKIVGDCRWGAIAAVTTARRLQIRVHNTANGREWEHNHNLSGLAPSGYSSSALCD